MSEYRSVLLHPHDAECWACPNVVNGNWPHPWAYFKDYVWRDKNGGHKGRTTAWYHITCNDPNCPAEMLVLGEDVDKHMPLHVFDPVKDTEPKEVS